MEPTQYYAIFLSSAFLLLGLRAFLLFLRNSMLACLKDLFTRKLRYPLLVRLVEITRLQTLVLVLYLGLNSLALALGLSATDIRGFEKRAATLAIINIIPMYLGGLANPLADLVGIPLSLHHLLHVWIGRVVIIEGLIHAILAIILRPLPGLISISGYLVCARELSRPWSRIIRVISPRIHLALAVSAIVLILWHVFLLTSTQARVLVSIAGGLWVLAVMYRWGMIYFYATRATVSEIWWDGSVISFDVHTERSVHMRPGGYFYLFLPGSIFRYHFFSSFPVVALWQNPENFQSMQAVGKAKDISFIISRSKHTRRLEQLDRGQKVLLHGPYGRDLQLESSENLIFTAKGIGILGVLQFAFSIAMRKYYDDRIRRDLKSIREERILHIRKAILVAKPLFCDSVRQVDIFWILDDNSQAFWIAKQINALQELDPEKVLLVFWCMHPTPQSGTAPFRESTHFRCYSPRPGMPSYDKLVIKKIQEESRSPGKITVIGCGESAFIENIRSGIVGTTNRAIRFVESEFRPSGPQRRPQRLVTVGLGDLTTVVSKRDSSSSLDDITAVISERGSSSSPETSEDESFTR
ncbi:hypothetical protein V8F33_008491 [Rhypophila sp. PSN 637]